MDMVVLAIVSAVIGAAVGLLSGMLGIGGGTMLVPLFKLGYGLAPLVCTATSLFAIIPTSISGAIMHIREKTCVVRFGVAAGIGGAITSPLGVWLASISPEWATMVAAAIIILYSAYTMLRKAIKMGAAKPAAAASDEDTSVKEAAEAGSGAKASMEAAISASAVTDTPSIDINDPRKLLIAAATGLVAGLLSGYVGVGGGFIMVPMFMQLLGTPMKKTSGTSLIAVMILAIPGVITQAIYGNVNWIAGIFVAFGSIPGAIIGARLMKRIPERALRFTFSAFLFVAATMLVVNQLGII